MSNLLSRINTSLLYPPFLKKIEELISNCQKLGMDYWVTSGVRTWAEQADIYAQGRTKPCPSCVKTNSKCAHIISKAPPGYSAHNYGIAVDFAFDLDINKIGLQPSWDKSKYKALADEAKKLGLESGYFWKFQDVPHVQLPLDGNGITFKNLRAIYALNSGGMVAVWKYLDGFKW
jgi:peptidoglycan L-alanyl-D-glutamate endopeptidase CwlK